MIVAKPTGQIDSIFQRMSQCLERWNGPTWERAEEKGLTAMLHHQLEHLRPNSIARYREGQEYRE